MLHDEKPILIILYFHYLVLILKPFQRNSLIYLQLKQNLRKNLQKKNILRNKS